MRKLQGLIAAPHTPFDNNNHVNLSAIDDIAALLIEQGVTGAYVCGTTGEGIHCSVEERKAIAERWVKAADGKLDLINNLAVERNAALYVEFKMHVVALARLYVHDSGELHRFMFRYRGATPLPCSAQAFVLLYQSTSVLVL